MMERQTHRQVSRRGTAFEPFYRSCSALCLAITILAIPSAVSANAPGEELLSTRTLGTIIPATAFNGTVNGQNGVLANRTVVLRKNETLAAMLERQGVPSDQRQAALRALGDLFDVSKLKSGDAVEFTMRTSADGKKAPRLAALHLMTGENQDLTIISDSEGAFHAKGRPVADIARIENSEWAFGVTAREGVVKQGLEKDLVAAQVPEAVAKDVMTAFTYDRDIPAKPAKGSRFNVVYEAISGLNAQQVLRYAEITIKGEQHRVYRYESNDGMVAFVEQDGRGVTPLQLASPVKTGKMTSPYGWRIHPVLKVRKFHNGVDFAAPKGTPIYAAEDGVVETIGYRGNYGRYLKVAHNDRVATAYAHMSGFAPGLKTGSKVHKGQVIAYIGRSGLATGNHLYYEVLVDNKQIDPLRDNIMLQVNLDGSALVQFRTYVAQLAAVTPSAQ